MLPEFWSVCVVWRRWLSVDCVYLFAVVCCFMLFGDNRCMLLLAVVVVCCPLLLFVVVVCCVLVCVRVVCRAVSRVGAVRRRCLLVAV